MTEPLARCEAAAQLVREVIDLATRRNRGIAPAWASDAPCVAAFERYVAYFEGFSTPADRLRLYEEQRDWVLSPKWRPLLFHGSPEQFEEHRFETLARLSAEFHTTPAERWIKWTQNYIPPSARPAK